MRTAKAVSALIASAALAMGCTQILGGDKDYHLAGGDTGGGGQGGSSVSTSTTGPSGADGGPAKCRLTHGDADCGAGMRCTIGNTITGATACVPISTSPLGKYAACSNDKACPSGTWCDSRTRVCMPFCTGASECGSGSCVAAVSGSDTPVPGALVCTAHCDPVTADPCGLNTNCVQDTTVLDFDCFASGGTPVGGVCNTDQNCGKGEVCTGNSGCIQWCTAPGDHPAVCKGGQCTEFADGAVSYDNKLYGYCP